MTNPETIDPSRTATLRVDVELHIDRGRVEDVTMYLAELSEMHPGAETLTEALNRPRRFVAVRARNTEQPFLVRRSAIRFVKITDANLDPRLLGHETHPTSVDLVRLELDGGETVEGTLSTFLQPDRPRLSDFFNFSSTAFVPLAVTDGVAYVNRDFISVVWL